MLDAVARTDHELRILEAMVDCAYGLGAAFGEAAKAQDDHAKKLELFDAFNRSFLAVRMGIRLSMTLRAPPKPARAEAAEHDPSEMAEADRPERDPGDPVERERERDQEPVSLPKFLATLRGVAADAARLDDALPADLRAGASTLQDLLVRAKAGAAASAAAQAPGDVDVLTRPPRAAPRTALFGSASVAPPLARRGADPPPPRRSG